MNEIMLEFDKLITNLAGNRFGRQIYAEQVIKKIKYDQQNVAVLPERIEDIASSFIQGFYSDLGEKYGREKALEILEFKTDNKQVIDKIKKSIETYGI